MKFKYGVIGMGLGFIYGLFIHINGSGRTAYNIIFGNGEWGPFELARQWLPALLGFVVLGLVIGSIIDRASKKKPD